MIHIDTIVVPQGAEYKAVCRGLAKANAGNIRVVAIPIGTNKIQQTLASYSVELNQAQSVLIMGLCGSLDPGYVVGGTVLYKNCLNIDRQQVNLQPELTAAIQQKLSVDLVAGITSDRIIFQATEKSKLSQTYPASVVDMEGYEYIKEFQDRELAVAMLRVISDDLTGDIPDLSRAIDLDGNIKAVAMAIAFGQQPIAAIRLIKGSLKGLKILEQVTYKLTALEVK